MIRTVIVCEHEVPTDFIVNATVRNSNARIKAYSSHTGISVNYVGTTPTQEASNAAALLEHGPSGLSPTTFRSAIAAAGSLEEQAYVLMDALPAYGTSDWNVIMPHLNSGFAAVLNRIDASVAISQQTALTTHTMIADLSEKLDDLKSGQIQLAEDVANLESETDSGIQNFSLGSYRDDLPPTLVTKTHEWDHAVYPIPISLSTSILEGDIFLDHHGTAFPVLKEVNTCLGATKVTYSTIPSDAIYRNHKHGPILGHHIGLFRWIDGDRMAVIDVYGISVGSEVPRGLMYMRAMRETLGLGEGPVVANVLFYNTMGREFNRAAALHGREAFTDFMTQEAETGSAAVRRMMEWLCARNIGSTFFVPSGDPVIERLPAVKRDAWFENPILPALAAALGNEDLIAAVKMIGEHVGRKNAQWGINQSDHAFVIRDLPPQARALLERLDSNVVGIVARTWLKKVGNMTSAAHTGRDRVSIIMRVYVDSEEFFPCLSCGKVYTTSGDRHLCGELDDAFAYLTECEKGYKYTERICHAKPVRHEKSREAGWDEKTLAVRYGDYVRIARDSFHILNVPPVRA